MKIICFCEILKNCNNNQFWRLWSVIFFLCLNEIAIIWYQFFFNLLKVNFWKIILLKHEKTYFKNTYSLTIIILIFNKYYVLWSPFENWNKLRVLSHLNNACLCDTLKFFNNILNIPDNAHTGFGGCKVLQQLTKQYVISWNTDTWAYFGFCCSGGFRRGRTQRASPLKL